MAIRNGRLLVDEYFNASQDMRKAMDKSSDEEIGKCSLSGRIVLKTMLSYYKVVISLDERGASIPVIGLCGLATALFGMPYYSVKETAKDLHRRYF
jgi:hypothetical protein